MSGYTVAFEIGKKEYSRKLVIDEQKLAWNISDAIDDALQDLCEDAAKLFVDEEHQLPEDFGDAFYDNVDVGGLRDAILLAAQDVMDCELVFDYPY